ncbi:hypothetical protein [Oceanicaulis sp. MMSF_3324]|uniref:hypothetical protein n=1 Tax=Oceanicaulis sp. MMSF_3324 TaxID=3046702 RepID=UPI00273F8F51|nr:hypothetical protein [Oceanicaulis sp. MMSF_3324]
MKLTKLLTGVAVAALLTGAANAQLVVADTDGDNSVEFASQVDLSAAAYQDELSITLSAADITAINALGVTDDINITLTVDGGLSFSTFLSGSNFTPATPLASCNLNISAGGSNGGTTVTFTSDASFDPNNCLGSSIGFTLPVDIEGVGNVSYELALASTGTVLASGDYNAAVAPATQDFYTARNSLDVTFTAGTAVPELDDSYELFDGSSTTDVVGNLRVDDVDGGATTYSVSVGGASVPFDTATAAQFDGAELVVTVPSPAGIASVTLAGIGTENLDANGQATFALTNADLTALSAALGVDVSLVADTTTPAAIANQDITADLTFDEATGSDLNVDDVLGATVGDVVREGSNTALFEWVGDSAAATSNVFRATGLGATLPTIRVTLANSTADVDGEYVVTPAGTLTNGELIMTEADIEAAVGSAFGRADVSFSFEAAGVSVRRFMVTNGVVSENTTDYAVGATPIGG